MDIILCSLHWHIEVVILAENIGENTSCKYLGIISLKIARDNWKRIEINLQRTDLNNGLNTDEGTLRQFAGFKA